MDNNIFSFDRFIKVLKYDLRFRVMGFALLFIVLLVSVHLFYFLIYSVGELRIVERVQTIQLLLFSCSFIAPFKIYREFRSSRGKASFIMLPTSAFEKFASMFVISLILVPVSFLLLSLALDYFAVLLFSNMGHDRFFLRYEEFISLADIDFSLCCPVIFTLVSAAIFGNVIFKKRALAKTMLCVIAMAYILSEAVTLITNFIFWNDERVYAGTWSVIHEYVQDISEKVCLAFSVLLYAFSYWRIKKMQIS